MWNGRNKYRIYLENHQDIEENAISRIWSVSEQLTDVVFGEISDSRGSHTVLCFLRSSSIRILFSPLFDYSLFPINSCKGNCQKDLFVKTKLNLVSIGSWIRNLLDIGREADLRNLEIEEKLEIFTHLMGCLSLDPYELRTDDRILPNLSLLKREIRLLFDSKGLKGDQPMHITETFYPIHHYSVPTRFFLPLETEQFYMHHQWSKRWNRVWCPE